MKNMVISPKLVRALPPEVGTWFRRWAEFMYQHVEFGLPESKIHGMGHCERVLLYALMLGVEEFDGDEKALEVLAHAAVFHDSRREEEGRDTGHGARAAEYYEGDCKEHPELVYRPEAACVMRYHDRNDQLGEAAITEAFGHDAPLVCAWYRVFKDAEALDRWRLGPRALNLNYLRTDRAAALAGFSRKMLALTTV